MNVEERAVSRALGEIDPAVPADFVNRVRMGGRRRLLRRRAGAGAVVVAAGAVAVPVAVTVGSGGGSRVEPTQRQHVYPGLYAAPPAAGSQCNAGVSDKASPSAYPDLLMLPEMSVKLTYAFVRSDRPACPAPHIALSAVQVQDDGGTFGAGLVVEGPNAPTAQEDGAVGPDQIFGGETGHEPIDGQPATEFTVTQDDHTSAYWTEPDGGQWHAVVRDLAQEQAVALLDRLVLDSRAGTATLPSAAKDGWTVEPAGPDALPDDTGVLDVRWIDPQGHTVDMTVTQTPNRIYEHAVDYGGSFQLITFRGAPAMVTAGAAPVIYWQPASDTEVMITINGATRSELLEAADLTLASPDDPRISSD